MDNDEKKLKLHNQRIAFRSKVAELIIAYSKDKDMVDPDMMAETLYVAAAKINNAYCMALKNAKEVFGEDQEGTVTE